MTYKLLIHTVLMLMLMVVIFEAGNDITRALKSVCPEPSEAKYQKTSL